MRETVYRERNGGRWEYWLYSDGARVFVGRREADKIVRQGGRLITVDA